MTESAADSVVGILPDVIDVMTSKPASKQGFKMQAHIFYDDTGDYVAPFFIDSLYVLKKYVENQFDTIELVMAVHTEQYAKKLLPNKDRLEVELLFIYYHVANYTDNADSQSPVIKRYKALMIDIEDRKTAGQDDDVTNDGRSRDSIKTVSLTLVDKTKDSALHSTIGTVIRRSTTANALQALMTHSFKLAGTSQEDTVQGVDIAPGHVKETIEHIVVPHMKQTLDLPRYLQEEEGGVYTTGIASYIQDKTCFVFSPFDVTMPTKTDRVLTILNLDSRTYPWAEVTWTILDGSLYILSTGETKVSDPSKIYHQTLGSGVRYANADSLFRVGGKAEKDNDLQIYQQRNMVDRAIINKRDAFNFLSPGTKPITANHCHEMSQLAEYNVSHVRLAWENAVVGFLYPGMAIRYLSIQDRLVKEYHGVLHNALHNVINSVHNKADPYFMDTAHLDIVITPEPVDIFKLRS